jgi:pyruvate-ferredoxin/flavodoxin oxidoreductase
MADRDHFGRAVLDALEFDGPALLHVHAPSPERHGFAIDRLLEQAALAVRSRAFPLFTFDPSAEGVFGSCLDLSANPDVKQTFCADAERGVLTPVHWAATERRFSAHLPDLDPSDPEPLPIREFLELDRAQREGKTPFIELEIDGVERKLRIDDVLLRDAEQRLRLWRTLQELAGVVTPFTQAVREEAERELSTTHTSDIELLKRKYEAEIAELKASFDTDAARRVTSRLMELAGYDSGGNGRNQPS